MISGDTEKQANLDLTSIFENDAIDDNAPLFCGVESNDPYDEALLAQQMLKETKEAIDKKLGGEFSFSVTNCDRSIGAMLSGEIARQHGVEGLADAPINLKLKGTAGQSFGVWNAHGLHMTLEGDANDYVGKGMAGGELTIFPPKDSTFAPKDAAIVGNTCLYGATGGRLMASGQAGERFAVRNSGATAVIEGAGDHCCEYMTGGVVTVLGETGVNFGAGMTGGFAYVLDQDRTFADKLNGELVEITRITSEPFGPYRNHLHRMISDFVTATGSAWGQEILDNFDDFINKFWLVKPKAANLEKLLANLSKAA